MDNDLLINGKGIKIFKIVYSAIIPVLIFAGGTYLPVDYSPLPILVGAMLHLLPFVFTLSLIKKACPDKALPLIIGDLVRVTCVSILSCVMCEVALLLMYGANQYRGLLALIMSLIFLLLWGVYALLYTLTIKHIKKKNDNK